MTAMSERYEGNFIGGIDLPKPATVTIESVAQPNTEKDATGKRIPDAILSFKGKRKRLILNKTNWRIIAAQHGKDEAKWPGKKITLQCRYLREFMGYKNVQCVRVVPPKGTPVPMGVMRFMGQATPFETGETKPHRGEPNPKPEQDAYDAYLSRIEACVDTDELGEAWDHIEVDGELSDAAKAGLKVLIDEKAEGLG